MRELNLIELSVDEIENTAGTQVRKVLDEKVIKEYAEWYQSGAQFPPLVVFAEEGSERYILADGFHRLEAAKSIGLDSIACDLHEGGWRDALEYALGANEDHGVRRTSKDKRNAIEIACKDPVWHEWSDRQIACLVKVSHTLVSKVRDELHLPKPEKVKTKQKKKDGTPVKQKAQKVAILPPSKPEPAVGGVDAGNRRDLLDAIATIKSLPFDGGEAVERLSLYDHELDFIFVAEWFKQALSEMERQRRQAVEPVAYVYDDVPF